MGCTSASVWPALARAFLMEKPEVRRGVGFVAGADVSDIGADCLDVAGTGASAGWAEALVCGDSETLSGGGAAAGVLSVDSGGIGPVFAAGAVRCSDFGATGAVPGVSPAVRCGGGGTVGVTTGVGCGLGVVGASGVTAVAIGAVCAGVTGV